MGYLSHWGLTLIDSPSDSYRVRFGTFRGGFGTLSVSILRHFIVTSLQSATYINIKK